ncbi:dnaJ homolog subfamily C member 9-like [Haliotis cracherodii]|uniref:dnaJ homolog subfamily C member 9-like n=1 Tax=Haliotis cracherodii TaxID=6455 RepID=UPI0039EAD522
MPGLIESCRDLYDTENLYDVLKVRKNASQQEIKKGYHKLSLKVHPDRVKEDDKSEATQKFQTLGKIYSILSDKEKRAIYDETGDIDEENDVEQDKDWYEYWRMLFAKISIKDIQEYEKKYKGSKEELKDLKAAYLESEGDMDQILESVLCATIDDEDRFAKILKDFIKKKEVPDFKAFSKESKTKKAKRRKEADAEAEEAKEAMKEIGMKETDSLKAMIQKRHAARGASADDFFAQLEAKYAEPKRPKPGTSRKSKSKS